MTTTAIDSTVAPTFSFGGALGADALCCDKAVEVIEFAKKHMPWVKTILPQIEKHKQCIAIKK